MQHTKIRARFVNQYQPSTTSDAHESYSNQSISQPNTGRTIQEAVARGIRTIQKQQRIAQVVKQFGITKCKGTLWVIIDTGIYKQVFQKELQAKMGRAIQQQFQTDLVQFKEKLNAKFQRFNSRQCQEWTLFAQQQIERAANLNIDSSAAIQQAIDELLDNKEFTATLDTMNGVFANEYDGKVYTIDDNAGISEISNYEKKLQTHQSRTLNLTSIPVPLLLPHKNPVEDLQWLIGKKLLANRSPSRFFAVRLIGNTTQQFCRILKGIANTHATSTQAATNARLAFAETSSAIDAFAQSDCTAMLLITTKHTSQLPQQWTTVTLTTPSIKTDSEMNEWLCKGALCQLPFGFSTSASTSPHNELSSLRIATQSISKSDSNNNISGAAVAVPPITPKVIKTLTHSEGVASLVDAVTQYVKNKKWRPTGNESTILHRYNNS